MEVREKPRSDFQYTVVGPGEYFIDEIFQGHKFPTFYTEKRLAALEFKLTDGYKDLVKTWKKVSLSLKTFEGCYWGKCYFCTYNESYLNKQKSLSQERANILIKTMNGINKTLTKLNSDLSVSFYFSHASIKRKNLRHMIEALNQYKKGNYSWVSFMRPEMWVKKHLADIGATKGIIDIGFEIISYRDVVNKGASVKEHVSLALAARENNVPVYGEFMYGIPKTDIKDMLYYLFGMCRIKHTLLCVALGQLWVEDCTYYSKNPDEFDITLYDVAPLTNYGQTEEEEEEEEDPKYKSGFAAVSGFTLKKGQRKWIGMNKKFLQAMEVVLEGKPETWEYYPDYMEKMEKSEALKIAHTFFPKEKELSYEIADHVWSIS